MTQVIKGLPVSSDHLAALLALTKMSLGESAYSFSLTTFSPSGKLVQIEHALRAVGSGTTALGIKAKNGVVVATEKKLPELMDESTLEKIVKITENIGIAYAGMGPDTRVLAKRGRKMAANYKLRYNDDIPVLELVKEIAAVMQEFTQRGGVRPFGVSLLVAGYDERGPQLYQVDPSGSYWAWKASAIGKAQNNAKSFLEKRYDEEAALEDAINMAILTLKEGFQGEMNERNIEIGIVSTDDKKFRTLSPAELKDYLDAM